MATVSITSDLEPYLASLRSYLADDSRQSPEKDPNEPVAVQTPPDGTQKKRTKQKDGKKPSSKERRPSRTH